MMSSPYRVAFFPFLLPTNCCPLILMFFSCCSWCSSLCVRPPSRKVFCTCGSLVQPSHHYSPIASPFLLPSSVSWGTAFYCGHTHTLPFSSFPSPLPSLSPQCLVRKCCPWDRAVVCFFLTFSLAKDGKFQRPELAMAGCLFWKSNGLDAKGMSWSYVSGKVVP